ncbi:hypothetical protein [Streptomyces sp. Z26]|uniref:hypothetical protein n=1 Tax=Streptomyces sp. Z26 TaxID=2500177 RepID=UPI000EF1329B|nr:hypothetical protein [Streptomyces sp. Z26]RLL68133.1 hypothetical protein D7M15_16235 [Streptomyces sp. Z26]
MYGGDPIGDFYRGDITLRRLRVLIEGLPPDGALGRAASGHAWTLADMRDADTLDVLGRLFVATYNANRAESAPELPWPDPVPRPGDPTPKQKAKAAKREKRAAREGYEDIVAQVAPGRI